MAARTPRDVDVQRAAEIAGSVSATCVYAGLSMRTIWTEPGGTYTHAIRGDNLSDNRYENQVQRGLTSIGAIRSKTLTHDIGISARF